MHFEIKGTPFPVLILSMDQGDAVITDAGAMSWMDPGLKMETTSKGGLGGAFGHMVSGETAFQNRYVAERPARLALASSFPGEIRMIEITPNKGIVLQKSSFLASDESVERKVVVQKKLSTGIFGGEGFIMSRYFGEGRLFIEIDGTAVEYDLERGQKLILDTGYLVAMDDTCKMEIESVKGLKNKVLGGEGLFNTVVTGPGHIIVQTMPFSVLAGRMMVGSGS